MSETRWRSEIEHLFAADTAAGYIQVVEALLNDENSAMLRNVVAELILELRTLRDLTQKIEQSATPELKNTVLHAYPDEPPITLADFTSTLLGNIAAARQLADVLKFYAQGLAE